MPDAQQFLMPKKSLDHNHNELSLAKIEENSAQGLIDPNRIVKVDNILNVKSLHKIDFRNQLNLTFGDYSSEQSPISFKDLTPVKPSFPDDMTEAMKTTQSGLPTPSQEEIADIAAVKEQEETVEEEIKQQLEANHPPPLSNNEINVRQAQQQNDEEEEGLE